MANNNSSQKFIARNRAPRVQIEYDVEIYGSEKKIELPFVMGHRAQVPRDRHRQFRRTHEGHPASRGVRGAQHAHR
jgi:predicted component of type VI protein secretion system